MAENKESTDTASAEEVVSEAYVSDQLAVKVWSVVARDLREGRSTVLLAKSWDAGQEGFVVFPTYADQDPDRIDPDVWMMWRHELKAPLAGHTRLRDFAEVAAVIPITEKKALSALEGEYGVSLVEARRQFAEGEPGLTAVVLRVHRLTRTYRFNDLAAAEANGKPTAELPFDVELDGMEPVIDDDEFEGRLRRIKTAITGEKDVSEEPVERLVATVTDHAEPLSSTYKKYAGILGVLAILTVSMIFIGESSMSGAPQVTLLLLGSAIKASLIIFFFMHLKFEKMGLILTVMIGIFITSILMFVVPAFDATTVLERSLYN